MANIYELSGDYLRLLDMLNELDATDDDYKAVLHDTMDSIKDAFDVKVENYVKVIKSLQGDENALKSEIKRLQDRLKTNQNNQKRMKEVITNQMDETGSERIKTPMFTIWTQNNPTSIEVLDESHIPDAFYDPQPPKLNKKFLKDSLESGNEIEGVRLTQGRGVRWR